MTFHIEDISYCSNVHAGEGIEDVLKNLTRFIQPVCQSRGLSSMATGLWLSAAAAKELTDKVILNQFKRVLYEQNLLLTSINGFPYGGFHKEEIKEGVYLPDWSSSDRLKYTKNLADVLAACLPEHCNTGTISTVPLGYKKYWSQQKHSAAITHLSEISEYLHQLKQNTGKSILLCLEMEPDCVLESTAELIEFFTNELYTKREHYSHLGTCFDVCHQAVMFEDVAESLSRIISAGIPIGKIQLSSALRAAFSSIDTTKTDDDLLTVLTQFCEPEYLHQVKSKNTDGRIVSCPDLPAAIKADLSETHFSEDHLSEEHLSTPTFKNDWRIHFHVPVNADYLLHPQLKTTRDDLLRVFDFLQQNRNIRPHLEVETYCWQVLPMSLRPQNDVDLIKGITSELLWVEAELNKRELLCMEKETIHEKKTAVSCY